MGRIMMAGVTHPPATAVPPAAAVLPVHTMQARTRTRAGGGWELTTIRAVELAPPGPPEGVQIDGLGELRHTDIVVIVEIDECCPRPWPDVADIIACGPERLPGPAAARISALLTRYPGAAMAMVRHGRNSRLLGLRDGRLVTMRVSAPPGRPATAGQGDVLLAAFLHSWLARGRPVEALAGATVRTDRSWRRVRFGPGNRDGADQ